MDILVTYDIADTEGVGASRLKCIAQVCEKYGQRVQFSVFECRLLTLRPSLSAGWRVAGADGGARVSPELTLRPSLSGPRPTLTK